MKKLSAELNNVATMLWCQIPLSVRLSFLLEPLFTHEKTAMSLGDHWRERQRQVVAGADPLLEEIFRQARTAAIGKRELNKMFWDVARKLKLTDMIDEGFDFGKTVEPVLKSGFNKFKNWGAEYDDLVMYVATKLLEQKGRGDSTGKRWDIQLKDAQKRGKHTDLKGLEIFFRIKAKSWASDWGRGVTGQGMMSVPRGQGAQTVRDAPGGESDIFSDMKEPSDLHGKVEARDLLRAIYDKMSDKLNRKLLKYVVDNNVTDVLKPTGGTGKLLRQVMEDAMGKEISPARASQIMKGKFIPDLMQAAKSVGAKENIKGLDRKMKSLVSARLRLINNIRVIADEIDSIHVVK